MKKVFKLAGMGFLLGMAICNVICLLCGGVDLVDSELVEKIGSEEKAILIQMLLAGIYGAVNMGTTVLYEAERMPLALVSFIHCMICIIPFIPLSIFLRWTENLKTTLIITSIQIAAYFMIWLIIYMLYRKEINKLNEMQKQAFPHSETEVTNEKIRA